MNKLSNRLKAIFDLIPEGCSVADIGTDHAYLPIALCLSKKVKKVIACDINRQPLLLARQNLDKSGCGFVETRLGDGLNTLSRNEADCIVIAGMGADVIISILNNSFQKEDKDILFLLQPMTGANDLRRWLFESGFEISETAVCDNCKVYTVISAKYTGIKRSISPSELFIGSMTGSTPAEKTYIKKQLKIISKCLEDIKNIEKLQNEYAFYLNAYNTIKKLTEL